MIVLDVLYVALATIAVMIVLQLATFIVTRMMYPPEPKIIYRDVPVSQPQQQMMQHQFPSQNGLAFTQPQQAIQLPEYAPRQVNTQQTVQLPDYEPRQSDTQPAFQLPEYEPRKPNTQPAFQLPEYEPRKPASTSLRVDPELPFGLQETRPDGT